MRLSKLIEQNYGLPKAERFDEILNEELKKLTDLKTKVERKHRSACSPLALVRRKRRHKNPLHTCVIRKVSKRKEINRNDF